MVVVLATIVVVEVVAPMATNEVVVGLLTFSVKYA